MPHITNAWRLWLTLLLLGCLSACGPVATAQNAAEKISLSLAGYNYTNRYIDSFSVEGQGGGNIYVSSPTSGGGGTVCCISFFPRAPDETVRVRWVADACYFSQKSTFSDQMLDNIYRIYKEQDAPVEVLAKDNAKYMEVHFYPDGAIKVAITAAISPPRLKLEKQREDLTRYPRCPGNRKPNN